MESCEPSPVRELGGLTFPQQPDKGDNHPALSNQGAEHPFQQFDFEG